MLARIKNFLSFLNGLLNFILYGRYDCVAAIILTKDNCIWLVKFAKEYGLPGGIVKHDESLEEAIKREVKEETGIIANSVKLFYSEERSGISKTFNVYEITNYELTLKSSLEGKPVKVNLVHLPKRMRGSHEKIIKLWLNQEKS